MQLKIDPQLKYAPGTKKIDSGAYNEFTSILGELAATSKHNTEIIKRYFAAAASAPNQESSTHDYAIRDMNRLVGEAKNNQIKFIEALYNSLEDIKAVDQNACIPDETTLNHILTQHSVGLVINNGELERTSGSVTPPSPPPKASEKLLLVINEQREKVNQGDYQGAILPVHTALHDYILSLIPTAETTISKRQNLTGAYKVLRENHPAFSTQQQKKILQALASVVNEINQFRNNMSSAHPGELATSVDAELVVNAANTIFNYIKGCIENYESQKTLTL